MHKLEYEKWGRLEDKMAWLGLLKHIGKEEIIRNLSSFGGSKNKGRKIIKRKSKISLNSEHKEKIRNAAKEMWLKRKQNGWVSTQIPWNKGYSGQDKR